MTIPPTQGGSANVLSNSSFEDATITTNWIVNGTATLTRDTSVARTGSASAKVAYASGVANPGISQVTTQGAAAAVGQVWTASAYVHGSGIVTIIIGERSAANANLVEGSAGSTTLTGSWQRITLTRTLANASVAKVIVKVTRPGTTAATGEIYIDDIQLELASSASAYGESGGAGVSGFIAIGSPTIGPLRVG